MAKAEKYSDLYYKSKCNLYKYPFIVIPCMLFIINFIIFLSIKVLRYYNINEIDNHISIRMIDIICEREEISQIKSYNSDIKFDYYRLYPSIESLLTNNGSKLVCYLNCSHEDEIPQIIEGDIPQKYNEILIPNNIVDTTTEAKTPLKVNDKLLLTINNIEYELIVSGIYDIFDMYEYKENIIFIHTDFCNQIYKNSNSAEIYRIICETSLDRERMISRLSNRYICYGSVGKDFLSDEKGKISLTINIMYIILFLVIVMSVIIFVCFMIKAVNNSKKINTLCRILGAKQTIIYYAECSMIIKMLLRTYTFSLIFEILALIVIFCLNTSFGVFCIFSLFIYLISFCLLLLFISMVYCFVNNYYMISLRERIM